AFDLGVMAFYQFDDGIDEGDVVEARTASRSPAPPAGARTPNSSHTHCIKEEYDDSIFTRRKVPHRP
ncbi:hypothetical protein ACC672_37030, partial [Rhizobium ruizarguesonis]